MHRKISRKESQFLTIDEHAKRHNGKYYSVMTTIGLINNTGYVMVGSASQKISEKFDKGNLMAAFQLALIIFSSFVRFINIRYLIKVLHRYRVYAIIIGSCAGFTVIAVSCTAEEDWGFYLSLVGSVMCGSMQALGEGVILGFLKSFPSTLVGAWSSGTGLSGILGTLLFILLNSQGVSLTLTFLCLIPLEFIYLVCFLWYDKMKAKFAPNAIVQQIRESQIQISLQKSGKVTRDSKQDIDEDFMDEQGNKITSDNFKTQYSQIDREEQRDLDSFEIRENSNQIIERKSSGEDVALPEEDADAQNNVEMNIANFKRIFPKLWFNAVNISLVYFFEYTCITGLANYITDRIKFQNVGDQDFFVKESYEILNFSYQLGVFLSRSSLSFIKIEKVWILTVIQFVNFIAYASFAIWDYMPMGGLVPVMLWIGFMGGASYVNVSYLVINTPSIPKKEKELSINIVNIFNDWGVLSASVFSLILDNYILPKNK